MMNDVYTIGFTKKTAEYFFNLIRNNKITLVIDVRLNNTSQLASFSKFPDIKFFLKEICNCNYIQDKNLSPTEDTLKRYKSKIISWERYIIEFNNTMSKRNIKEYLEETYSESIKKENICLLCSEDEPNFCHRRLVAEIFSSIFNCKIEHII